MILPEHAAIAGAGHAARMTGPDAAL